MVMQQHLSWYPVQTGPPAQQQRKAETNTESETVSIQAVFEHGHTLKHAVIIYIIHILATIIM